MYTCGQFEHKHTLKRFIW